MNQYSITVSATAGDNSVTFSCSPFADAESPDIMRCEDGGTTCDRIPSATRAEIDRVAENLWTEIETAARAALKTPPAKDDYTTFFSKTVSGIVIDAELFCD